MADLSQLPLRSPDGATGELACCDVPGARDAALVVPAMGVPAGYYLPFLQALAGAGVACAAMDLRGTGTSSVKPRRGTDFGYDEIARLDVPAAAAALRARWPQAQLHAIGHSLGGQMIALALARQPDLFASLILVASGSVDHRGFPLPTNYSVLVRSQMANAVAAALGYFPGHRLGFGGLQPRRLIGDWSRQIRSGRYQPSGEPFDYEGALAKVRLPILGLCAAGDDLTTRRNTELLCEKLAACTVELRSVAIAAGKGHVHFRWARQPEPVVAEIGQWLNRPTSGSHTAP